MNNEVRFKILSYAWMKFLTLLKIGTLGQVRELLRSKILYSTVQCSAVHYSAVQCSTVQCSTLQCCRMQFSKIIFNTATVAKKI